VNFLPIRTQSCCSEVLTNGYPHSSLPVTRLPSWFPGAGFKRLARKWARDTRILLDSPYEFVREQLVCRSSRLSGLVHADMINGNRQVAGTNTPSFVSSLIENQDLTLEEEYMIKWTSLAIYGGGIDTVNTYFFFFSA
jgi:hypothetical protein